jgi:hypothetical protein
MHVQTHPPKQPLWSSPLFLIIAFSAVALGVFGMIGWPFSDDPSGQVETRSLGLGENGLRTASSAADAGSDSSESPRPSSTDGDAPSPASGIERLRGANAPFAEELEALLENWGREERSAAEKLVAQLVFTMAPDGPNSKAPAWSREELDLAAQRIGALKDSPTRNLLIRELGAAYLTEDPRAGLSLVGVIGEREAREEYLTELATRWARTDPEATSVWRADLPAGELRDRVTRSLVAEWAIREAPAAADYVATELTGDSVQAKAAQEVAVRWAGADPPMAMAWVAQFPDGAIREELLHLAIPYWSSKDHPALERWIGALPQSRLRADAERIYADWRKTSGS